MSSSPTVRSMVALLVALGVTLGVSQPAHAGNLKLRYSADGGSNWTTQDVTSGQSVYVGDFEFIVTGQQNSAGTMAAVDLQVNGTATAAYNFIVQLALTNVSVPPGQNLSYAFTGVKDGPAPSMRTYLTPTADPFNTTSPIFQTGSVALGQSGQSSLAATPNFSLMTSLQFSGNTNDFVMLDGNNTLASAVPAPAGLVLALTGLPLLALFARRRKRGAAAAPSDGEDRPASANG